MCTWAANYWLEWVPMLCFHYPQMTLLAIENHRPICWIICFITFVALSFPYWLWRRVIPYT
jgi:hypothetical protein